MLGALLDRVAPAALLRDGVLGQLLAADSTTAATLQTVANSLDTLTQGVAVRAHVPADV